MTGFSESLDQVDESATDPEVDLYGEEEIAKAKRSLAAFFGYHQGPQPRPGARVRIKRESGTVIGHDPGDDLFVLMDSGSRRLRHRKEVTSDKSPRLSLAQYLRLCGQHAVESGDSICLVQLANHFKGVNGTQYANRSAFLWSVHGACLAGWLGGETSKFVEWLNKEIQTESDLAGLPPLLDAAEVAACDLRPRKLASDPERLAKVVDAARRALEVGKQSIDLADSDQPHAPDPEDFERHLAIDVAHEQQVVILGRAVANPTSGFVDVIDLDSLTAYTVHVSGLDLAEDVMDPGWFWDVLTQSAQKHPKGTAAGWLATNLKGPDGNDADIEARRRAGLFGALISLRHAVIGRSESTAKRLLKRAKDLHKTLDKAERTRLAAIAPELVRPQVNSKVRLGSLEVLAPHMRSAVEVMLHDLPPPELPEPAESLTPPLPAPEVARRRDDESAVAPAPLVSASAPAVPKRVSFVRPAQPLRFSITDHLLLTMEWQLVDDPGSFANAVATAVDWLEQRMGTSLPKHWREGAHEIELSGVALQIESTKKLFAFRLEHPDIEHPTRWWRVEVTVLEGRSGSGGMVGLRMQVRDLVDLAPPERSMPALIRNWAAKPGLVIAGARAGQATQIRSADQFDRLQRIVEKRDRPAPVWVVARGGVRLSQNGPLGGLARVLVVDPELRSYAQEFGELDSKTIHIFPPRSPHPTVVSTSEAGWQKRLQLLSLEMLQSVSTPSFRDVRDAIHAYRAEVRAKPAVPAPTEAATPRSAASVIEAASASGPEVEIGEAIERGLGPETPARKQEAESTVPVEFLEGKAEVEADSGDDSDTGPSMEDIQLIVRREVREYEELLGLAEAERDEAKSELMQAQSFIATLQWQLQALQDHARVARPEPTPRPATPTDLSELPGWVPTLAPRVVFADKALRVAAKTEHKEVPKIIASLQALHDLYWVTKFGDAETRGEANEQWKRFLMQNRMTFSGVGKAVNNSRYEHEYKAVVDGVSYTADMHVSGSSTHDPLRCLRIYTKVDEDKEQIVVIHLPTHLTNSLT